MSTRVDETNTARGVPIFDRLLFVILTAVLCARPLISESFEHAASSFLPDTPGGTTPATTVWLDGILLVTAAVVWIRHWQRGPRVLAIIGFILLLSAIIVSVSAAGNKRLAANAGAHLFVLALSAGALARLMRARWMVHLLIAAVLAAGITNAAKCINQRVEEFDSTFEAWQEQKAVLAANGVDVDAPMIVNYERRLRSGETFGYLFHPNVTGSYLAMCLLVATGVFVGVLRKSGVKPDQRAAAALVAALLMLISTVGMWLTGSMGAAVAAIIAGVLLLVLGLARRRVAGHARGVCILLVSAYVGIIAIGAGYGMLKGTLPHVSLAFRWQYWQAAAQAVTDAPLTGIGRENFRAAYLLYKSPESTEEINNPHNLWLTLLVELGPLGLIAGMLLIGTVICRAVRGFDQAGRSPPTRSGIGILVAVAAGVLLVQAVFSGEQFGTPGILLLWSVYVAGVWVLAFVIAHSLIAQVDEHPDAAGWLVAGLIAALAAALVHNLIGFSLFTPAGLAVFAALSASALAIRSTKPWERETTIGKNAAARGIIAVPAVLAIAGYVWFVATPTIRGEAMLERIERELKEAPELDEAYRLLHQATDALQCDHWNPELPLWLAENAFHLSHYGELSENTRAEWLDMADRYALEASRRNTASFSLTQLRARIARSDAAMSGEQARLLDANTLWEAAVSLYPTNPRTHISAGNVQFQVWKQTGQSAFARRSVMNYRAALAIDAMRKPEVAAKLRPMELEAVHRHLDELRTADFD